MDPPESFPRQERLRERKVFSACYRHGRRFHRTGFMVLIVANELGYPRLGITVGRKVGKAVRRHRIKRWVREIYRRSAHRAQLGGLDFVVHFHPRPLERSFVELKHDIDDVLKQVATRGALGGEAGR